MKTDLIISGIAFVIIYTFLYFFYMIKLSYYSGNSKKKKSKKDIIEIRYLMVTYKLKKEKLMTKKILSLISLIDAFIITFVFLVVSQIPYDAIWQLMVGFVLLLGLIYSIYGILGKILLKRGYGE